MESVAKVDIAGVNTRPLVQACVGVAGNWSSPLRAKMPAIFRRPAEIGANRLGDQAAQRGWERGVLFTTYSYLTCPRDRTGMRWRGEFERLFGLATRTMPLWLDCGAYPRWTGSAPRWDSIERYCQAIDLIRPAGYMSYDYIGDMRASLNGYAAMRAWGYQPVPVYQIRARWDSRAGAIVQDRYGVLDDVSRTAIANARAAAQDPVLQYLCSQSKLVAIGGMARGPCPMSGRVAYLAELCRRFPDHQFWALAQARDRIVNGLGQRDLLDRVWIDGPWWIHNARCERMAVVRDGLLQAIDLRGTARGFFTLAVLMAANLRSLMGAAACGHSRSRRPCPTRAMRTGWSN